MTPQTAPRVSFFKNHGWAACLFLGVFLCGLLALAVPRQAQAAENHRYASFVMDADTGMILYQSNANKSLHPASLTKVMTLILLFDAIERGNVTLWDRITISKHAASMQPSKLDLPAGSTIRVRDAIFALVTKSANDVAVAIAEHLGGTEENFAQMMTARAQDFDMTRTRFRNASGLHDPRQISTARDMARMAQVLINQYGEHYSYFSKRSFTYRGKTYQNHNKLLGKYEGMDGLKTGYIQPSGFNLIASAVRNNRRIIGVVFGGQSSASRNAHMVQLLDNGFNKLGDIRVANAPIPVPQRKPGILLAYAHLNELNPAAEHAMPDAEDHAAIQTASATQRWKDLNSALQSGMFGQVIGEGDFDPASSRRIETGLMAISAHRGNTANQKAGFNTAVYKGGANPLKFAAFSPSAKSKENAALKAPESPDSWAIQIGAFQSRNKIDQAIKRAFTALPEDLSHSSPVIVPLKTANGWVFRGRLTGYTKGQAMKACSIIKECMPIAPVTR